MRQWVPMSRENALALALEALAWIVADNAERPRFMDEAGLQPIDLHHGARDPAFLEAVLDYLLQQDVRVRAFAMAGGHPPTAVAEARAVLAGPAARHWT